MSMRCEAERCGCKSLFSFVSTAMLGDYSLLKIVLEPANMITLFFVEISEAWLVSTFDVSLE